MKLIFADPDDKRVLRRCLPDKNDEVLYIPEGVEHLEEFALRDCDNLKRIVLPSTIAPDAGGYLTCEGLETIEVSADHPVFVSRDGVLFRNDPDGFTLARYPAGRKERVYIIPRDVYRVGDHAFYNSRYLGNVLITKRVRFLDSYALAGCLKLHYVQMDNEHAIRIGAYALGFNTLLENVQLNGKVDRVEQHAFIGSALKFLSLPEGLTHIGQGAFACCSYLETIVLPQSITHIGVDTFRYCSSLRHVFCTRAVSCLIPELRDVVRIHKAF